MTYSEFIEAVRLAADRSLYPEEVADHGAAFDLLMHRPGPIFLRGRHALAVSKWDESVTPRAQIASVRQAATTLLDAKGLFWRVGLYLVFQAERRTWPDVGADPDKTGLHDVVIQAIHFVDITTGEDRLHRSTWGPVRFGVGNPTSPAIKSILEKGANNASQVTSQ